MKALTIERMVVNYSAIEDTQPVDHVVMMIDEFEQDLWCQGTCFEEVTYSEYLEGGCDCDDSYSPPYCPVCGI